MAKKKQPHQEKSRNDDSQQQSNLNPTKTDDSDQPNDNNNDDVGNSIEKFSSLKSLNALLLKETVEKRQEVSSLLESKKSLETELTRSVSQVEALKAELTRMEEVDIDGDVRKMVVGVFVETQMVGEIESLRKEKVRLARKLESLEKEFVKGDLKSKAEIGGLKNVEMELRGEVDKVGVENECLKKEIEVKNDEGEKMKEVIVGFETRERSLRDEVGELKGRYDAVVSDLSGSKSKIEEMKVELGVLEKGCDELKKEIESLRDEKDAVLREKDELLKEKSQFEAKVKASEKEVSGLNAIVFSLKEVEEKGRVKSVELEKTNNEMSKKIGELENELNGLMEEKKMKESEIERLVDEKLSLSGSISDLEKDLVAMKQVKEETLEEKDRLVQVKSRLENEIVELQNKVNELMGSLASLQELNIDYIEKNKGLVAEIEGYKASVKRALSERDDVKKTLEEEKMNGMKLQGKVSEMSKKVEDTAKVIEESRAASDSLVKEKKELENKLTNLMNKMSVSDKNYGDAKMKITELDRMMKSKTDAFESVLAMLKDVTGQVTRNLNGNEKDGNEGEIEAYMSEVERIRLEFKSRDEKMGEMEEELESMKWSVMEARKKKSMWTLVSSCATLFAAIASYAYVSKVR